MANFCLCQLKNCLKWHGMSEILRLTMLNKLFSIIRLDLDQARKEVLPFVKTPEALQVWSREFFLETVRRIRCV